MSENQSSLRFSLEESVWFKRGQEVEELLSISLDPHITIQEQEQYIVIQGKLFLSGEFRNNAVPVEEEEVSWQKKYVHTLDYREEDGVYEFNHQFPVDITIPKDKVEDVSYLDVTVDSFDYDLLEDLCLKLNADLTISGLRDEEEHTSVEEETEPVASIRNQTVYEQEGEIDDSSYQAENEEHSQEDEELIPIYNLSRNDSADYEEEDEEEEELYQPFNVEVRKVPNEYSNEEHNPTVAFDVHQTNTENQNPYNAYQFSPSTFDESLERKKKKAIVPEEESSSSSFTEIELVQDESPNVHQYQEVSVEDHHIVEEVEVTEDSKKKKKKEKYESISLTDFFARKQDEKAAKLRMCIVQSGETLDYLADKYNISVQQILRMNHMETNQNLSEGQVLYIPSYAGKK
ncbi:MAG: LysM peptidoglycan-binding domain-containing protein [Heyndrickxia sp.]